jgi:hypothetical protein
MKRLAFVLLAAAMLTSACTVFDEPACGCSPAPTRNGADVAAAFAERVGSNDSEAAWRLLNDAARRHYRDESAFARELPRLAAELGSTTGGTQPGNWKTIDETVPSLDDLGAELMIPILGAPATPTAGRLALPVDSGGDPTNLDDRIGVPLAADLALKEPTQGATGRPSFTVELPGENSVALNLISTTDLTAMPHGVQLTAGVVSSGARRTAGGYSYTWEPDTAPLPGRYLFTATVTDGHGEWTSWNAVPVTVGP